MTKTLIKNLLDTLIGERVRIQIRLNETDGQFGPQVAVFGILEGDVEANNFRVLSDGEDNTRACYSYFSVEDITCTADRRGTKKRTFNGGESAVLYLGGKPTHPYEGSDNDDMPLIIMADGSSKPAIIIA